MKILQICQRPQRRGAEIFAFQLSSELRARGHEVITAYLYPANGASELPLRYDDRALQGDETHPLETVIGFHPGLFRRLKSLMEEFRPDITQVNGARTVKYGALVRSLGGVSAGSVIYRNIGASGDWVRGIRRRAFYGAVLRRVDGVAAISDSSMRVLEPILTSRVMRAVISNAIDPASLHALLDRSAARQAASTPERVPVVLFVGSLTSEKRVDRLLEAWEQARREVPDLHLWIIGDGPLRPTLEAQAERTGAAAAVRFLGATEDVASYMKASDVLALSSDTEGVPAVVLEAGYLGLPVVATRVGGISEVIHDGQTGLVVGPADVREFGLALVRLCSDPPLRAMLGTKARTYVTERHTISAIATQYIDFYEQVQAAGSRRVEHAIASPTSGAADRP